MSFVVDISKGFSLKKGLVCGMLGLKMFCYQLLFQDGGSYTTSKTKEAKL